LQRARLPHPPAGAIHGARPGEELDRETRRFFSGTRNLRVDRAQRTVYVSELLDFYPEDFGPDLVGFVARFSPEPIPPGFGVAFIEYDWTIADSRCSR
jgi:hypothetical protein